MNVKETIKHLEQYPDDYVVVVSKDRQEHYVLVAIDPMKYSEQRQRHIIDAVLADRRKSEEVDRGESVRTNTTY